MFKYQFRHNNVIHVRTYRHVLAMYMHICMYIIIYIYIFVLMYASFIAITMNRIEIDTKL